MTRSFYLVAVSCVLALRNAEAAIPFPDALVSSDVRITDIKKLGTLGNETGWEMNLNLAKAVATVTSSAETATVRALAHANVFSITSRRKLEPVGVPQKSLPAATTGTSISSRTSRGVTVGDAFVSFPTETAGTYSVRRKQ